MTTENRSLSLYELTANMIALLESEEEITQEQMDDAFGAITAKENKIAFFLRDIENSIKAHKEEEQRLAARRTAMENKVKRLKELVKDSMDRLGLKRVETGTFSLCIQNSAPALEIDPEAKPRGEYCILIPAQREWDKAKIKEDLKNGKQLKFARLKQGSHLRIR